ncbi:c-type cytochrome biogenesis protein CcmI [Ramlibacter sp. PS3R-8]|uniref:c-type cytochrome biogenesis protein CcmI n=1 Tax=Ramlibacter sp. PS3R-8 TaxID=3133437 RepID=UPI0030A6F6DD
MTGLWLAAVALLVIALLFVVPPLLGTSRRSTVARQSVARHLHGDQLAQIEQDLQSGALDEHHREQAVNDVRLQALEEASQPSSRAQLAPRPWMGWGVAAALSIGLPAAALALYLQVGNPRAVAVLAANQPEAHESGGVEMEVAVSRLAARLRTQPDDLEGWTVLARSLEFLQRYDDAAAAYQRALAIAPNQPQLLADYADALGSARSGDLSGPAQAAIDAALAIDADHPKALALAGAAAFKRGDIAVARQHWEHLLSRLPPDSELAQLIGADLARLESPNTSNHAGVPSRKHVGGQVAIAPSLQDKVAPDDTVFVIARAQAAGPMPVAVLRLRVKDLPAKFVLDDSLAMSPERPISRFGKLTIDVRVSRSGQAAPQPGDLAGSMVGVSLGQEGIELRVDRLIP